MLEDRDWKPIKYIVRRPVEQVAFQVAVNKNFSEVVKTFLELEPRVLPNLINSRGYTALSEAAKRGFVDTVRVLVNHEATDVNKRTTFYRYRDGYATALHLAIQKRSLETVQVLLRCPRIQASLRDDKGMTPLALTASLGCTDIATTLEHGSRYDRALLDAFQNWRTSKPAVQSMVRYRSRDYEATLDETTIKSRAHLANFLFNRKGYCYKDVCISQRWARIHLMPLAVKVNDVDLLQVLLNLDSITLDDVNEKMCGPWDYQSFSRTYRTPLNYARSRGYTEIANLLAAHGAADEFHDPHGDLAVWEKVALELATKDNESTQPAKEQSTLCEASRETPELALSDEGDSDSDLEE
ncbi:hypothetical protein E8E11_004297 [Didymella keratinophila]|nr:hypothetical protein E8E11_004297 [Didymella keratinophila]